MTDPRHPLRLSLIDPYYPIAYREEFTNKPKGAAVTFFEYLQTYLRDITYEYVHYDEYRGPSNRSLHDLGGVLGAIVDGKVLTELTGAGAFPAFLQVFDFSPQFTTDTLAFYEANIGDESWSPLSYFVPFSLPIVTLAIVALVSIELLEIRKRRRSLIAAILTGISSALFVFGVTFLVFAYGAGFQGNVIAALPPEKIPYDVLLSEFESGARKWYFRIFGIVDALFSPLSSIPRYQEPNVPKLVQLMCERPGVVTVALYKEEYLELQLYDAPAGCNIQKINLVAPIRPSPTFSNFDTTYYYFLLPKKLPRRLREGINFVASSVFQPDHVEGYLLYRSVKPRSFVDITPVKAPLAEYSSLSLYGLGVIILIFDVLLSVSIFAFVLEIISYRLTDEGLMEMSDGGFPVAKCIVSSKTPSIVCMAAWHSNTLVQGCFEAGQTQLEDMNCRKKECVAPERGIGHYFCCCFGPLCNQNHTVEKSDP
ncbi:hypothetical protein PRIPAC_81131 [Pristionchus pacificus]|uniref:Uncharacterized protein n=1 Tax=Pristionchus pacificus TaxID=54126 RepID=A0A2A6BY96_PRIPA|nr:hypothetical protein PRIPAC_81131 [Pristionchus pacificus]|eukprot:PDM70816.1 hypothetical protein PRIPAC_45020 [Pristionchus pacificus]